MAEKKLKIPNTVENLAGQSEKRDRRVLTYIMDQVKGILAGRTVLEQKWMVMDAMWRGNPVSRYYPKEMTTHINEPYKMVSAAAARVLPAVVPGDDWFRLVPGGPAAIEPKAAKEMMKEQFKDGRFQQRLYGFIQGLGKYGGYAAKVPWVVDRKTVKVSQPVRSAKTNRMGEFDGVQVKVKREEQELNHDRTELIPLNIYDFIFDWRYEHPNLAPGCGDYCRISREDVFRNKAIELDGGTTLYQGIDAEQIMRLGGVKAQAPNLPGKDLQERQSGAEGIQRQPENEVNRLDWWGLIDISDSDENEERVEAHAIILDDQYLVHLSVNNLWHRNRPYIFTCWEWIEGQAYGMGLIEPIVPLVLDLNDNQNTVTAAGALSANPMVKCGDKFNIPDVSFTVTPGKVWRGEDVTQLQPFHVPDPTSINRSNRAELRQDIEEVLGQPRLVMGGETEGGGTATEFAGRRREANIRLRPVIGNLFNDVLGPFLEMCLYNNQQFLDEKRVVRYQHRAGQYRAYEVTPEDLASIARVEALTPPQIELLGVRGQMMTNFLTGIAQLGPLAQQQPYRSLLKMSWINQFGYEDIDKVWPEEAEKMQETQREELIVMLTGEFIEVLETDNHPAHMEELAIYMNSRDFDKQSAKIRGIVNAHYANHEMWFRRQEQSAASAVPPGGDLEGAAMQAGGMQLPVPAGMGAENMPMEGQMAGRQLAEEQRQGVQ